MKHRITRFMRSNRIPVLAVFLAGLGFAAIGARWWQGQIYADAEPQFLHSVERISAEVSRRFRQPISGLNGARGMYATSLNVRRGDFRAYVEARDLPRDFPGVRGFGFIKRVMRSELGAFIAAERADGAPNFEVHQLADRSHDDLFIIQFIESAVKNAGAQGLDIGSEEVRRTGAQRAIDTGEPTITGTITLVQDQRKTPGVLLYVPVYTRGSRPANIAERRASLVGLLYAPIVLAELLDGVPDVTSGRIDFELFDSTTDLTKDSLVYDADNHVATLSAGKSATAGRRYSKTQTLPLPGRMFTLRVNSTQAFDSSIDQISPWLVFLGFSLVSTLLALLLQQQISGRQRAEELAEKMTEKLRQDEERSSDFSKSASDWFWETDAENRFCYLSDNFETVCALSPTQLMGRSRKELLEQDGLTPPEVLAAHLAQLQVHSPFKNFEFRTRNRTGEVIWVAVSGIPHFGVEGRFAGYRGTGTLITERKFVAESLQASEARHRALFERSKIPMLLIDPDDGSIIDANGAAKAYYGYPLESLRRMHMSDIDQLPHGESEAELALAKAENRDSSHFSHRLASGEIRQVEVRSGPLTVDGRTLLYYFIQDITERHAAEMALVNETARMYALLETASDGIHILDENGKLVQFSHSFPAMLGYTDDEIAEFGWWNWDPAIPRDKAADAVRQLISVPAKFEATHRCKDGSLIDVEINAKGVTIGGNTFLYASSRDITERKRIERMKGEFVSTVSHELRTPLTSISGGLGLVVGGALGEIPEKAKLMLEIAHKNSLRLAHLINDLLDMEKLVAGMMILDLETQPLMPLVDHTLETVHAYGEQYGVKFAVVARADDVRVCVDGIRLQQVLTNFLSNAAKFSPQGGVVEVAARRIDAMVRVEVIDHGPGIPEEFRSRIFQKFSQADSSDARKMGGTGLGLAISKELVERMNGSIGFQSEPGRGACFYFELKVCAAVA